MSPLVRNIRLGVEYEGSDWHGWQLQSNAPSIQGELERALLRITGETIRLTGASRTDAGVHARGQVCNFYTESGIPLFRFPFALNANLPDSIVITGADLVAADFHARYHALGKSYIYTINNNPLPAAIGRQFSWHVPRRLEVTTMQEAAASLVGRHDFRAFQAVGSPVADTVREIHRLRLEQAADGYIRILVEGNGFLYKMVRTIVGTLVEVGKGKMAAAAVASVLKGGNRAQAGPTAPPHGLCLEKVFYGPQPVLTAEKS